MIKPILTIYEQVDPAPLPYNRFRILETVVTVDGYRTRVCDKGYATLEEAQHNCKDSREPKPEDIKRAISLYEEDGEPKHFEPSHYVLCKGTHSAVKVADFFEEQKRTSKPSETWWQAWKPVYVEVGDDPGLGIEAARELAAHMMPFDAHWKKSRLEPFLPDATALCPGASRYQECRGKWRSPIA